MFVFFYHIVPVLYVAAALFGIGLIVQQLVKRIL